MKAISMLDISARRTKALLLLAVLTLTAVVYSYVPQCDFMFMDDSSYVKDNALIKDFTPGGIKKIFLSFWNEDLPLVHLSFAIDYKLWGLDPGAYHAENVAFHLLNVLLVFFLIYLLRRKYEVALLAALFFGIHPCRVESVAWIVERKDMLYAFFYLLGLISYVFYVRKNFKIYFLILALFFFSLSLMSKTAAIVFPFVLFLLDYFYGRRITWRLFLEKAPFFFVVGIALWIHSRISFADTAWIYPTQSFNDFSSRFLMACYAFSFYVIQCFVPFSYNFTHFYPIGGPSGLPLIYCLSPIFVLLFLWLMNILTENAKNQRREILFGFLFFLFNIGLVLHLMPIGGKVVVAERYTYMAYLGFFFIASSLFVKAMCDPFLKSRGARAALWGLLIVCVAGFSLTAYDRSKIWRNAASMMHDIFLKNSNHPMAYIMRGQERDARSDFQGAMSDYSKSISLFHSPQGYVSRADLKYRSGDYQGAIADLTEALALAPDLPVALHNRGMLFEVIGDDKNAFADYSSVIDVSRNASPWQKVSCYSRRGRFKLRMNDSEGALSDFLKALEMDRTFPDVYFDRGVWYLSQKRLDEALVDFNKVIDLSPRMAKAYLNRAICFFYKREYEKAWRDVQSLQRMGESAPKQFLEVLSSHRASALSSGKGSNS